MSLFPSSTRRLLALATASVFVPVLLGMTAYAAGPGPTAPSVDIAPDGQTQNYLDVTQIPGVDASGAPVVR